MLARKVRASFSARDDLASQDFGVATKKGADDLTAFINGVLAEMKTNGDMDTLIKKWGLD